MRRGDLVTVLVCSAVLVLGHPAPGQVVGGGGAPSTDCLVTYDSVPAPNYPPAKPRHVRCADQDATCGDTDARLGYCQFQLQLAFKSSTLPGCTPGDVNGFLIPYSGATNDDHPKHIADFEPFQTFFDDNGPITTLDQTTGFHNVTVPMTIGFTAKGPVFKPTTVAMHPTACATALSNGRCPMGVAKDVDTLNLTCTPALDAMGQTISPCTGITGTFQQIQEHIFDRKCSTMATCHGSAGEVHHLCLKADCDAGTHHAYSDLVGITPNNALAANDGLKRVDPSTPTNSLLVHKINGGAQLNNTTVGAGAYGARMPYNNPSAGRARPKLSHAEIQLITDWIAAGAPPSGFVTTTARGACGP